MTGTMVFTKMIIIVALYALCGSVFGQEGKYWTGDGGKGIRLMVREPEGKGISKDDQWVLSVVQGVISANLGKFSNITVLDRQKIETIMAEQKEAMSARYSDETRIKLGELTGASHILSGTVIKTPNAFMLELSVTDLQSGEQKASYSQAVSSAAFENRSAMGEATADLLSQLGVSLTGAAFEELKQAANIVRIQAQEALAKGIVADRQGTEVAALSYFYQAVALDPSLLEAADRSSVMAVDISSGNIGENTRNKIQWRNDWVARLTEAEQFFDNLFKTSSLPYILFYSTRIMEGDIDYQVGTQTLSINTKLYASPEVRIWLSSVEKSLQAVYDGLEATEMKAEWGLQNWPWSGVTDLKPFENKSKIFYIVVELVNSNNKVIGRANFQSGYTWGFNRSGRPKINISEDDRKKVNFANVRTDDITDAVESVNGSNKARGFNRSGRPKVSISEDDRKKVNFANIRADEITDNLTIRIASVNGIDANTATQTGVLQIKTIISKVINGIECVLVEAGTFMMGSPENEANRVNNETQHKVTLTKDYWISKYPITNAQYGKKAGGANHPVVGINWAQAVAWAKSKGGLLPTEAEWEFAARGGNWSEGYIYSGGNNLDEVGWYKGNSVGETKSVGQKYPNELGIYDMSGNVYEWCSDWYDSYDTSAVTNPAGSGTSRYRVIRGGDWNAYAQFCRVAYRDYNSPTGKYSIVGFRVVFPRN